MKMTHRSLLSIYRTLLGHFGPQYWWPAKTEFEMLVGAILTQNTHWRNVEKALTNLSSHLEPHALLSLSQTDLSELIRPSGYYNQKAHRLLLFTRWLTETFESIEHAKQSKTCTLRASLLTLTGIGPETADSMLVYTFKKPVFIIDAYTRRIFSRLGYNVPVSYEAFRQQLETALGNHLSVELCNEFHALIVIEAKEFCKVKPHCLPCPLHKQCAYCKKQFRKISKFL